MPCVEGATVTERTGPDSVKAEILVKMGAMSMTFTGTVDIVEKDPAAHRAVLNVKAREAGGQGHANATVEFALQDGGGTIHTNAQITGKAASMGRGSSRACSTPSSPTSRERSAGSEARRTDPLSDGEDRHAADPAREVPRDGGTAIQEDAGRPVFHGNGPDDYACVECGNVLAAAMDAEYMTKKVRVRCGRCGTVNVAVTEEPDAPVR